MPRPGPRPYECVRRAWHSDRHQPIRGSIIQEIFRVVYEIHSSTTKKNKEWQEKLPLVVLKAEEIMYSKANSETEYMDLKTLWDRTNDAINTIIRLDESTETGDLLQPCIEAALNLGCTARRASRSQRNCNPRSYLNPIAQERSGVDYNTQGNHAMNPQYMVDYLNFRKPTTNGNCGSNKFAFASDTVPPSNSTQCLHMEVCPASKSCSVYPLYHGFGHPGFTIIDKSISSTMEPSKTGVVKDLFFNNVDVSEKIIKTVNSNNNERPCNIECDLSLRLGTSSVPCSSVKNIQHQEVEDVSYTSIDRYKINGKIPLMNKGLSFLSRGNVDDPLDSRSSKWRIEVGTLNVEAKLRKRKAIFSHPLEDEQFRRHP
ncbi:hypothetical protein CFOL_v3_29144 [Cephalotus follicularis]|uniref:Histone acetyltransferase n=1 Tax=Cephalotus follicularis TaxID=3775 RepID=A0A1Q3CZQ6_CEPFO|nr:hypothetical protein CFOL_v3_29144 [Cephalotus follicularis]